MLRKSITAILSVSFLLLLNACSKDEETNTSTATGDVDITSVVQAKFSNSITNAVTVTVSGDNIIIKSDGRPNHKSPYWGVNNSLYEPFPAGHATNPGGAIVTQNFTMTIPAKPAKASVHEATSLNAIGMALNGAAIFNDQDGPNTPLDLGRISSLDGAGAHPQQEGVYHYHVTGTYTTLNDSNLIGFLRDGFPIYGRKDMDGTYPSNLDEFNGHISATTEFPNGIYHYHTRNENYLNTGYYILKSGSYYGTKGTFTQ